MDFLNCEVKSLYGTISLDHPLVPVEFQGKKDRENVKLCCLLFQE